MAKCVKRKLDAEDTLQTAFFLKTQVLPHVKLDSPTLAALGEAVWPLMDIVLSQLEQRRIESTEIVHVLTRVGAFNMLKKFVDAHPECASYAFRCACWDGHLAVAQWLADRFGLTAEDAKYNNNYAFRGACMNGHLAVAQWLVERFHLTAEDAKSGNNEAFRGACRNGHLAVAQWLAKCFSLTAEDARSENNYAFRWAREDGHLAVAQWLTDNF